MTEKLLITGGASGIGQAIAHVGLDRGWEVIVIDIQQSPVGTSYIADLTDPASTDQALNDIVSSGPVTRLVNNVGAVFPATIDYQNLDDFDRSFNLNLRSAVQCTKAVLPGMEECGFGRIVNMSSRAVLGKEMRSAYVAAKAGLIGLTRVWSLEMASKGITVNSIAPGPIATDLFKKANPPQSSRTQAIVQGIPVGRLGTPEEVGYAANFFLDENSGFITGQTLYVCGGLTVGSAGI